MPESELEPKDLKTVTEQVVEISAEEEERILNLEERELKREVLTVGPLGPISAIARAYLHRYMSKPKVEEKPIAERLRELEQKGGVPYLMALREAGFARQAAEKQASAVWRRQREEARKSESAKVDGSG
ncbi:hypothetical protein C8F04DRAFT_1269530 [Mycena alexandri]|uniref:Uncharacterized protein n=1 Tax=Mycena alexandri TaxID=1745969 RepID=A0AAD6SDV9_9AGAR|nr:hypothetical protein C8F04DRAFT_1269530 [Mycena alexandri]